MKNSESDIILNTEVHSYRHYKMYPKKLTILTILLAITANCLACRLIVPAELLNGCIFDPMIVSVSHSGFSVSRDNCNTAVAKHVFAEQPLVYYGRARSVSIRDRFQFIIFEQFCTDFKDNDTSRKKLFILLPKLYWPYNTV